MSGMKLNDLDDRDGIHAAIAQQLQDAGLQEQASVQRFEGDAAAVYVATDAGIWIGAANFADGSLSGELVPWREVTGLRLLTGRTLDYTSLTLRLEMPPMEVRAHHQGRPGLQAVREFATIVTQQIRRVP